MKEVKELMEALQLLILVLILASVVGACLILVFYPPSNREDARKVLEQSGYTNVTFPNTSGRFRCGRGGDLYATPFKAKSITGVEVKGTVCRGVTSGASIRL